jgi:hypothetical protein
MVRPPVVLALSGIEASSSASAYVEGDVFVFCGWPGGGPAGGAYCDCGSDICWGVGLRGGASLYELLGVGACWMIVGFGRVCSRGFEVD